MKLIFSVNSRFMNMNMKYEHELYFVHHNQNNTQGFEVELKVCSKETETGFR